MNPDPHPLPDPDPTRPTVLITGAAGGLGRALCRAFLDAGWNVHGGIHREPIPVPHDRLTAVRLDVTEPGAADRAVAEVCRRAGRLDVLVNNAGIARDGILPRMADAEWDAVLGVNLTGAFRCSRAALAVMARAGGGHIIHIGSFGGRTGRAGQANYVASKAGLLGFAAALAREAAAHGIQVNTVLPGFLPTGLVGHLSEADLSRAAGENLLGRLNDPAEAARFIVHLAGMRNVSAQVFSLDSRPAPWG